VSDLAAGRLLGSAVGEGSSAGRPKTGESIASESAGPMRGSPNSHRRSPLAQPDLRLPTWPRCSSGHAPSLPSKNHASPSALRQNAH